METVHVYCGCCIALSRAIRDRERSPQLEPHPWSVQVTCLIVVEDIVRDARSRSEVAGVVICKGSECKGIGIEDGRCEPPVIGLGKA